MFARLAKYTSSAIIRNSLHTPYTQQRFQPVNYTLFKAMYSFIHPKYGKLPYETKTIEYKGPYEKINFFLFPLNAASYPDVETTYYAGSCYIDEATKKVEKKEELTIYGQAVSEFYHVINLDKSNSPYTYSAHIHLSKIFATFKDFYSNQSAHFSNLANEIAKEKQTEISIVIPALQKEFAAFDKRYQDEPGTRIKDYAEICAKYHLSDIQIAYLTIEDLWKIPENRTNAVTNSEFTEACEKLIELDKDKSQYSYFAYNMLAKLNARYSRFCAGYSKENAQKAENEPDKNKYFIIMPVPECPELDEVLDPERWRGIYP
ncbi:MAG: hypothetical protein ACK4PR_04715 [Gammaproteobacteria bacterium]